MEKFFAWNIPGKVHKYGVKIYKITATKGYTCNYSIYTSEQAPVADVGYAGTVMMNLLDGLSGRYRTVVADNFFTSISHA